MGRRVNPVTRRAATTRDRGFALLIVLWTMVLLALLVTRITASGRTEAQVAANLRGSAVAEAAADAAVNATLFHLLALGGERWGLAGHHRLNVSGAEVDVDVENLAGRVNLNTSSPELLRALLDVLGVQPYKAASLAAAILDWRTPSQRPHPGGAKAPQYQAAGRDYGPPGAPFRGLGELGDVLGMTPALLQRLRPHVTAWGEDGPDPAFADPVVLAALRELGNGAVVPGGNGSDVLVVAVTAAATGPASSRFVRHAVVEIAPVPHGKPWRVLAWSSSS